MATVKYGSFKTAHSQYEIPAQVTLANGLKVGQLVTISSGAMTAATTLTAATHIIAQGDMTALGDVDAVTKGNYGYSDTVAASATNKKKVMVYKITDKDDIIVTDKTE